MQLPKTLNSKIQTRPGSYVYILCVCAAVAWSSIIAAEEPVPGTGQTRHSVVRLIKKQTSSVALADATNVIKVEYKCPKAPGAIHVCTLRITKKEFDALVQAFDPKMPQSSRQSLAIEYSRLLIMSAEARRRGIDRSPEFQTLLRFSSLQLLATRLVRNVSATLRTISTEEVENYFRDHAHDYTRVVLSRIIVPDQPKGTNHVTVTPAEHAQQIYGRAMNGEDFANLQREVMSSATLGPHVRIGPLACHSLPESHRHVCDIDVGKISPPLRDSAGYAIYRLESRDDVGIASVRDEIRTMLGRKQLEHEIESVRTPIALKLDERYFGKLPKPDVLIEHGMHHPPASAVRTQPMQSHRQH
jgi:hypothetical protein